MLNRANRCDYSNQLFCLHVPNRTGRLYKEDASLFSSCNADCQCPETHWDPVCGENGLTYVSPCLAGCQTTLGSGIKTVSRLQALGRCVILEQWSVFVVLRFQRKCATKCASLKSGFPKAHSRVCTTCLSSAQRLYWIFLTSPKLPETVTSLFCLNIEVSVHLRIVCRLFSSRTSRVSCIFQAFCIFCPFLLKSCQTKQLCNCRRVFRIKREQDQWCQTKSSLWRSVYSAHQLLTTNVD